MCKYIRRLRILYSYIPRFPFKKIIIIKRRIIVNKKMGETWESIYVRMFFYFQIIKTYQGFEKGNAYLSKYAKVDPHSYPSLLCQSK